MNGHRRDHELIAVRCHFADDTNRLSLAFPSSSPSVLHYRHCVSSSATKQHHEAIPTAHTTPHYALHSIVPTSVHLSAPVIIIQRIDVITLKLHSRPAIYRVDHWGSISSCLLIAQSAVSFSSLDSIKVCVKAAYYDGRNSVSDGPNVTIAAPKRPREQMITSPFLAYQISLTIKPYTVQ